MKGENKMNNRLLEEMFKMSRWEGLIEKAELKGIDKGELRKMCTPQVRLAIYNAIKNEEMEFAPAHMAQIPKETPGEFRTVFVGENVDRCIQSLINDCLFELFPEMIHPSCKSYQKNLGTGKTVKEFSKSLVNMKSNNGVVGVKSDFSHYFDVVKIEAIFHVFDVIEEKLGFPKDTEPVMNLLRKAWNNNLVFDLDGNLIEQYCGIRQGNAIGSFLADTILYELDEFMSNKYKFYCRYSDDCMTLHNNPQEVIADMNKIISKYGVSLNPKKVEQVYKDRWVKFLGFNIKGDQITLSPSRVKSFQKEIASRTIKQRDISMTRAVNSVNNFLYKGDGRYSWATSVLPIINVDKDIETLNTYVMDALRACATKKTKIGGLGSVNDQPDHTILRGTGKNVTANRMKTEKEIPGYLTLKCMQNAILTRRAVYETLVRCM
jgi:hypothetical protein